jgi:hypothetical protein
MIMLDPKPASRVMAKVVKKIPEESIDISRFGGESKVETYFLEAEVFPSPPHFHHTPPAPCFSLIPINH